MLLDKFEASLPENVMDVSEQKNTVIENLKLNLSQEEHQKVVASSEFKNWNEVLLAHIFDIRLAQVHSLDQSTIRVIQDPIRCFLNKDPHADGKNGLV